MATPQEVAHSVAEEVDVIFYSQGDSAKAHLLQLNTRAFALAICQMMDVELQWNCTEQFLRCGYSRQAIEERRRYYLETAVILKDRVAQA